MTNIHGLTYKQQGFIDDYLQGSSELIGNATQCAMKWFDIKDIETASAIGYEYLRKPHIKAYMEGKTKSIQEILTENSTLLLNKALELANQGNTSVLNKLLDKIMPTVIENNNTNKNLSPDEMLRQITQNALKQHDNKADIGNNATEQNSTVPVTSSNNKDLQKQTAKS